MAVAVTVGRGEAEELRADGHGRVVVDLGVADLVGVGGALDLLVVAVRELDDHLVRPVLARDRGDGGVELGDHLPAGLVADGVRLVRGVERALADLRDHVGGRDVLLLDLAAGDAGDLGRALERELDRGHLAVGDGHEDLVVGGGGREERRAVVGRGVLHVAVGGEQVVHHGGGVLQLVRGRGEERAVNLRDDDELTVGLDGPGGEAHAVRVAGHVDFDGDGLVVVGLGRIGVHLRGEGRHGGTVAVQREGEEGGRDDDASVAAAEGRGGGGGGGHEDGTGHGTVLRTSRLALHS